MRALYIHGFNSAGFGGKVNALRAQYGSANVLNPSLPTQPEAAFQLLDDLVGRINSPDFFILGSSLGGFYSLNLALRHDVTTVLVNPAIAQISPGLRQYLGQNTNYKTQEVYDFSEADLAAIDALELSPDDWVQLKSRRIYAYFDADDEVLPTALTSAFLHEKGLYTKVYAGGDHLFQHMPEMLADLDQQWGDSLQAC